MGAVAVWTWVGAVVVALVVLGFCAYEIVWKTRRLGRDVEKLQELKTQLTALQTQVAQAQTTVGSIQEHRAGIGGSGEREALFAGPSRGGRR